MEYNLGFITDDDLFNHVKTTVGSYSFEMNLETGRQSAKRSSRESLKKLQAQEEQDPKFVEFLRQFGQHLKDAFSGWNVFVLTADMALPGQLRIKESKRTPLFNGPLECRLFKFEMHSKRSSSTED